MLQQVHLSKIVNGNKKAKPRLVAKHYQEENNIKSDFFLQSHSIGKKIFMKPLKEADKLMKVQIKYGK